MFNPEMLKQLFQQQQNKTTNMTQEDLLKHQEPVAMAMRSLMKILEYERGYLPADIFNNMVDSLKENLDKALEGVKAPVLPPMGDIVSINGEPATPVSGA